MKYVRGNSAIRTIRNGDKFHKERVFVTAAQGKNHPGKVRISYWSELEKRWASAWVDESELEEDSVVKKNEHR